MDMFDFANLAADMGLDAIEPTSYYFPHDVTSDYLHRLKQHAFLLGLDISSTAIGNNFCFPPGPKREEQLTLTRTWIDRAAELDAPVIRIFAGSVPRGETEERAVAWAIEGIKESLPYAAKKGVTLALENHGGITATVGQILKLVRACRRPELRREPRHRQLPRRGSLRRDRRAGPLRRHRAGQDRDPPQGAHANEEADLSRLISILREVRYSGYVILDTRPKRTHSRPSRDISRSCAS